MKTSGTLLLASLLSLGASAQKNNTTIHADIKGLEAGQKVYYYSMMNSQQKDSVLSAAGGFTINMNIPEGDLYYIMIGKSYGNNAFTLAYLEPGKVEVKG